MRIGNLALSWPVLHSIGVPRLCSSPLFCSSPLVSAPCCAFVYFLSATLVSCLGVPRLRLYLLVSARLRFICSSLLVSTRRRSSLLLATFSFVVPRCASSPLVSARLCSSPLYLLVSARIYSSPLVSAPYYAFFCDEVDPCTLMSDFVSNRSIK